MPSNPVNDLITDQEMTFARLVLAGAMTDRQAAESAGLNPDTAAYTKAKPRVREYMLEHRAAVLKLIMEQEAQELQQRKASRERVLARLWELAGLGHEATRNSITGQIKAISMIVAIEGHLPDRRAAARSSVEPQSVVNVYKAPWLPDQQEQAAAAAAASEPAAPSPNTIPVTISDPNSLESLLAPQAKPWEKAPAPSYTSSWVPDAQPEVRFTIPRKPFGGGR